MDRICYVYIYNFRILKNVEIVIDPHYKYKYCHETNKLSIEKQNVLPNDFWGNSIYSLTGIFGNNASGKSSTLSLLLTAIVDGIDENTFNDLDALIVYEKEGNLVYSLRPDRTIVTSLERVNYDSAVRIPCFYYSGHFSPYSTYNLDPRYVEYAGSYIASDSWRLVDDVEKRLNIESHSLGNSMAVHVESYWIQNSYRICSLLSNEKLMASFDSFKFPSVILLKLDMSGWKALEIMNKQNPQLYDKMPKLILPQNDRKQRILTQIVYYGLANYLHDYQEQKSILLQIIKDWQMLVQEGDGANDIISCFLKYTKMISPHCGTAGVDLCKMASAIAIIEEIFSYDEALGVFYLKVSDKTKLAKLKDEIVGFKGFLSGKLIDLEFRYDLSTSISSMMSSGEQELLNFFSRLYHAVIVKPDKFANVHSSAVLMLDEAENSFHPKWQRQYVKLIVDFCNLIAVDYMHSFQIIITSHSPLLLSDIPKCCGNYLKRDEDIITNMRESIPESFCQNVFRQYKNSFFMEEGLIGEYALATINGIKIDIEQGRTDLAKKKITLISDPVINGYLTEQLTKKESLDPVQYKLRMIEYYKKKAAELESKNE